MQIRRRYTRANVEQLFFPVEEHGLLYFDKSTRKAYNIPGYKALVDAESGRTLSVVSSHYKTVTNKDAYNIVRPIASELFGGHGVGDFECFNVYMPKSRASCRIDLTRPQTCSFVLPNDDKYMAFIRIANSYNRTSRLSLTIGFCRWICQNGCIFGEKSYTLSVDHADNRLGDPGFLRKVADEATAAIGDLATVQKTFMDALVMLTHVRVDRRQMRNLFCRVNEIYLDEGGVAALTGKRRERLIEINSRLDSLVDSYVEEFGETAYAAYNVLTDFASYPNANKQHPIYSPSLQRRVGAWLVDFTDYIKSANGDIDGYLDEYAESAALLGRLRDIPAQSAAAPKFAQQDFGF